MIVNSFHLLVCLIFGWGLMWSGCLILLSFCPLVKVCLSPVAIVEPTSCHVSKNCCCQIHYSCYSWVQKLVLWVICYMLYALLYCIDSLFIGNTKWNLQIGLMKIWQICNKFYEKTTSLFLNTHIIQIALWTHHKVLLIKFFWLTF